MVKGIPQFKARMRSAPDIVRNEVADTLYKIAEKLVKEMQAFAPKRTGALALTIDWTWGDAPAGTVTVGRVASHEYDRIGITIFAGGEDAFYAHFQEFGTVKMPANPFFFPAYRANKKAIRRRLTAAVRRGFKKV